VLIEPVASVDHVLVRTEVPGRPLTIEVEEP
jgi:hypothetical protein